MICFFINTKVFYIASCIKGQLKLDIEAAFKHIEEVNYWDESRPRRTGFLRQKYLEEIFGYVDSRLLKVLMGQRRSGKSTIFKQVISALITQGVNAKNILYLNFELHPLHFIQTDEILAETVSLYLKKMKPEGKIYLFFDEIQEVEKWEKIVNSYLATDKYDFDIFLTGSNAHLLSAELSTFVTGRYIEIAVFPFSYSEYVNYFKLPINRDSLIAYIESSGLPELFSLTDDKQKISYLSSLQDSILMNDVVKRYNIKNPKLLTLLLDFMVDNIGHLFSLNAIVKKLKSMDVPMNVVTVGNYIHYLERTFLIHSVSRYDVRGKKILEGERKYYLNDLAFSNYLKSSFDNGINRKLENFVYQTLAQSGYKIHVGNLYQVEIDFVAEINNRVLYIQVTYLLHSKLVIDREYGNLEKIKDNWPKIVVTLDDVKFPDREGIQHIPAWKFSEYIDEFSKRLS